MWVVVCVGGVEGQTWSLLSLCPLQLHPTAVSIDHRGPSWWARNRSGGGGGGVRGGEVGEGMMLPPLGNVSL